MSWHDGDPGVTPEQEEKLRLVSNHSHDHVQ